MIKESGELNPDTLMPTKREIYCDVCGKKLYEVHIPKTDWEIQCEEATNYFHKTIRIRIEEGHQENFIIWRYDLCEYCDSRLLSELHDAIQPLPEKLIPKLMSDHKRFVNWCSKHQMNLKQQEREERKC